MNKQAPPAHPSSPAPTQGATWSVTIWNEYRHEQHNEHVKKLYPQGIHGAVADLLGQDETEIRTATLDEPEHGLTEEVLANTDVLFGGATVPTEKSKTTSSPGSNSGSSVAWVW